MSRRWRYPRARRGEFFDYPKPDQTPPPRITSQRARQGVPARRGEFQSVPPETIVTAGPGPLVQPPYRWPIRRGMFARRGEFFYVPLVGLAPTAPSAAPSFIIARRQRTYPTRRRLVFPIPVPQSAPVPFQTCRRKPQRSVRRGHFYEPPWPFVPPQPSVWRPDLVRARRRPPALPYLRRVHWQQPPWPQIGPPPIIDANGRVVVTQTTVSTVEPASTGSGSIDVTQTVASTIFGSSAVAGTTSVDQTADGRADVG